MSLLILLALFILGTAQIVLTSISAMWCGGNGNPPKLHDFVISCIFATLATVPLSGEGYLYQLAAILCTAVWMQTGHATAYDMGSYPQLAQSGRKEFLSAFIDPICKLFRQPLGGLFYCTTFMFLKGFLIGLCQPYLSASLIIGAAWPICYYIGHIKVKQWGWKMDGDALAEALTGYVVGIVGFVEILIILVNHAK